MKSLLQRREGEYLQHLYLNIGYILFYAINKTNYIELFLLAVEL